jgi:ssDNA thymidine ADP-ribosyltransferase, DarT
MTYYRNLQKYLKDGAIYAKNSPSVQAGYRISLDDIVARRGSSIFTTPCESNVNDFVPFYFSPITKMAYTIHVGNVDLKAPSSESLGRANMDDVAFVVVDPSRLFASGRDCWFTDIACNSAIPPVYENDPTKLESHVAWSLFDDTPSTAQINEIGYNGVCRWQHDRDEPLAYQQRSKKRMAEFLIKDHLRMDEVSCIVLKTVTYQKEMQSWVAAAGANTPVLVKPGCFF